MALTIWIVLIVFFVALCRGAAVGDGRDLALTESYPSRSAGAARADAGPRTSIAGLVMLEDRPVPAPHNLQARARRVRGHAGHYAAGS